MELFSAVVSRSLCESPEIWHHSYSMRPARAGQFEDEARYRQAWWSFGRLVGEPLSAHPALANDLIALAWENDARVVAVRVEDLPEDAFALRSGLLGEMAQKFVNYRLQLVIVGDVAGYQTGSKPFRDYVYETNQGDTLWFLPDMTTLEGRLG